MATAKPPWDEAKWEAEFLQLKVALAEAVAAWAVLEDELALLLSAMLDGYDGDNGLAIYFTPSAAETRIQIVDAVFSRHFKQYLDGAFLLPWGRLLDKINAGRRLRNKIAHGSLAKFHTGKKPIVRLTGTYLRERQQEPAQLPGMSLHDVRMARRSFDHCSAAVKVLANAAHFGHGSEHALRQTVELLETHLKTSSDRVDGQTLLGPEVPPRSSED